MNRLYFQAVAIIAVAAGVLSATGEQGKPNADQKKTPEGRVETTLRHDTWLWGADAWFLRSEPNDLNADAGVRQAVRLALSTNDGRPVLWVHLKMRLERLSRLVGEFDPNNPRLDAGCFAGLIAGKKPGITPIVPVGQIRSEGSHRFLDQNLVFRLPEKASLVELDVGTTRPLCVAMFSLSRLLRSTDKIFPRVRPARHVYALDIITIHAKRLGMKALDPNHVRFFNQPQGYVAQAVDINLVTGKLILYPGTHDKWTQRETTINAENLRQLREALASDVFRRIPEQDSKLGADGYSYFIEVDLNGSYLWKLHWVPDDESFKEIADLIKRIAPPARIETQTK